MFEYKRLSQKEWYTKLIMELKQRDPSVVWSPGNSVDVLISTMAEGMWFNQEMMIKMLEEKKFMTMHHGHFRSFRDAAHDYKPVHLWDPATCQEAENLAMSSGPVDDMPTLIGKALQGVLKETKASDFSNPMPMIQSGCDHEWVTWTGLFNTQTDCKKCGAVKDADLDDCDINID